jgi:hypothetical protein
LSSRNSSLKIETTSSRALRSSNPNSNQKHVSWAEGTITTLRKKKVIIDPEQEAGILEKIRKETFMTVKESQRANLKVQIITIDLQESHNRVFNKRPLLLKAQHEASQTNRIRPSAT